MRCVLTPHPDTAGPAVSRLTVEFERAGPDRLWLRYVLEGDDDLIVWPEPQSAHRADGLWRHTCFEAFVAGPDGTYREFNFSPSGAWAAYDFEDYRKGMRPARVRPPGIALDAAEAMVALEAVATVPAGGSRLALAAVIEQVDGAISYWALAHPQGRPDFHHPDCFAARVPAPDRK